MPEIISCTRDLLGKMKVKDKEEGARVASRAFSPGHWSDTGTRRGERKEG